MIWSSILATVPRRLLSTAWLLWRVVELTGDVSVQDTKNGHSFVCKCRNTPKSAHPLFVNKHHPWVASFPGHSHLQYLIACSVQTRRVKVWEIQCLTKNLEALSYTISLRAGGQSISKEYRLSFTISEMFRHETGIITVGPPPVCLRTIYLM